MPSDGESAVSLRLVDALQPGINMRSQVWTAVPVDAPDTKLILKIIQPSMCFALNSTQIGRSPTKTPGIWLTEKRGFTKISRTSKASPITTPCQEPAWVLVLEYIPGSTDEEIIKCKSVPVIKNLVSPSWRRLFILISWHEAILGMGAVDRLARNEWALTDIRLRNIILTGPLDAPSAVIIDLFRAMIIATQHRQRMRKLKVAEFGVKLMKDVAEYYEEGSQEIVEWGLEDETVNGMQE
ncbi:hypothetical protein C8R45DRAFT_1087672 [Mycena sanguinolenta]|nr:hypothetical protein C8R45DRAFT_1087672 [Mycena sanguinolenta]